MTAAWSVRFARSRIRRADAAFVIKIKETTSGLSVATSSGHVVIDRAGRSAL